MAYVQIEKPNRECRYSDIITGDYFYTKADGPTRIFLALDGGGYVELSTGKYFKDDNNIEDYDCVKIIDPITINPKG